MNGTYLTPTMCATCVEMTVANQEFEQELIRLRKTDAILRKVNRILRQDVQKLREDLDAVFLAMCERESLVSVEDTEVDRIIET